MNKEHFTFPLQYKHSGMFVNMKNCLTPQSENARPHSSNSIENATPWCQLCKCDPIQRHIPISGYTSPSSFLDFSPLLIFLRIRELRVSSEAVNTSSRATRKKNLWLLWTWISLSITRQGQERTLGLGLVDIFFKHASQYDWSVWLAISRGRWGYLSLQFLWKIFVCKILQSSVYTRSRFACVRHGLCFSGCLPKNFDLGTRGEFYRDWKSHRTSKPCSQL